MWLIKAPFLLIWNIIKGIFWVIFLPFRFLAKLIQALIRVLPVLIVVGVVAAVVFYLLNNPPSPSPNTPSSKNNTSSDSNLDEDDAIAIVRAYRAAGYYSEEAIYIWVDCPGDYRCIPNSPNPRQHVFDRWEKTVQHCPALNPGGTWEATYYQGGDYWRVTYTLPYSQSVWNVEDDTGQITFTSSGKC